MNIPFTGIVVTLNEEKYLRQCLHHLNFCNQLIVVDLGSTDRSVQIAKESRAEVILFPKMPIVEQVLASVIEKYSKNDWVILVDPDEIFPTDIIPQIIKLIEDTPNVAIFRIPTRYYFLGKPLHTTRWGTKNTKLTIHNKNRVRFLPNVHSGREVLEGFQTLTVKPDDPTLIIHHFWIDTYEQLIEKHTRYLLHEGQARYDRGQRFSWIKLFFVITKSLFQDLFLYKGILGGKNGLYLSFFYANYILRAWLSLRKYQQSMHQ